MTDQERLYTMKLHDVFNFGDTEVMRVEDGWIYTIKRVLGTPGSNWVGYGLTSTFVPLPAPTPKKVKPRRFHGNY